MSSDIQSAAPPTWQTSEFSNILTPYARASTTLLEGRAHPALWDICSGCILWLPKRVQISAETLQKFPLLSSALQPEAFDHPVLVLDVSISSPFDASIKFAFMNSFGNRSIRDVHPGRERKYIPISPTPPHQRDTAPLHLENEGPKRSMTAYSYLCIADQYYDIDWKELRCYASGQKPDGYRFRLAQKSFALAANRMRFEPSAWIPTDNLWEKFIDDWLRTGS